MAKIDLLSAVREIVRRAIITLAATRDPDKRFLGLSQMPQNVVHDVQEAYGYSSTAVRNFQPTAYEITQMDVVLPFLAWLRRQEGDIAVRRIIAWSMDVPNWRIAQREGCSERTILNRIDRSMVAIIGKFMGGGVEVEEIDEPYRGTPYALVFERPTIMNAPIQVLKVYVGGLGMVRGGRKLRTAIETA